ncbi:BlaI/MecI/CopY family transcriptional regulator [Microbulbifer sp. 2304DJ12-6]|uniref:BlaI/MecI/CopY family transcriptional regulator n=1 Tax=Microbulbifer sp. 2304DJ12-6 TaxID=3233340 RepID=UPI00261A8040|nr:BlaI/MecI/CopY family transcriptional regulator [uncultured Microbulbifer sp.]
MTDEKKTISVAESKVMEALWRTQPLSAEDITAEIAEEQSWSVGTIKSLLNRLMSKEAISAEKHGRKYLYSPNLTREDYMSAEGRGVLDRLFEGRVSSLFAHFSKHENLCAEDIADLKKAIRELENDN